MKFKYILILSALIGQILSLSAREVTLSMKDGYSNAGLFHRTR